MTLVEITFELQSPLTAKQLADLAEFANTYGLRRFRHDEAHNLITFEYDASRLRQSQVVHALAGANIAVKRIVPQSGAEIIPASRFAGSSCRGPSLSAQGNRMPRPLPTFIILLLASTNFAPALAQNQPKPVTPSHQPA